MAWRLIGLAAVWLVAAFAGALLGGLLLGLGLPSVVAGHIVPLNALGFLLGSMASIQLVLLCASWRRGRIVGNGDIAAGLGWLPARRRWLAPLLGLLLVVNVIALLALVQLTGLPLPRLRVDTTRLLNSIGEVSVITQAVLVLLVLLVVVGAPIAEELFFRGWLWTGLRKRWSPLPVMIVTSLLWLLAHSPEGLARPLFLVPGAITLSLARHLCESTRVSMALHCFNNSLAVGLLAIALHNT